MSCCLVEMPSRTKRGYTSSIGREIPAKSTATTDSMKTTGRWVRDAGWNWLRLVSESGYDVTRRVGPARLVQSTISENKPDGSCSIVHFFQPWVSAPEAHLVQGRSTRTSRTVVTTIVRSPRSSLASPPVYATS